MLDLQLLENSGFFKKITLKKGDIIFNEGDLDNNIYIIIYGELSVEKFTSKEKNETKQLTYLKTNDIFGEGSLNASKKKEVSIKASRNTILLSINAVEGVNNFISKYNTEGINFLKYIIYLSHKRLVETNNIITSSYKISKEIIKIDLINYRSIFKLIEKLKEIINVDEIKYYEKSPVLDDYIILKYDTTIPGRMQDKIIELTDSKLDLLSFRIGDMFSFIQKLEIGSKNYGFLVFLRKGKKFGINDQKILVTASTSIAGLIKQKQMMDEERDKKSMKI